MTELSPTRLEQLDPNLDGQGGATTSRAVAHRGWILAVLALSQLMMVLDGTIMNIALPTAQRDLGFATAQRQWVIIAYSLAFGGLLLLGGRLSDIRGRRLSFIVGLIGFASSSMLVGASVNFAMLVVGRAAQGAFAALLAPAAMSLLITTFVDQRERARAFGVFGAVAGSGAAFGLVLGGVLTQSISWRWCLYINLFFAAAAIVGAVLFVGSDGSRASRPRLDLPGAVAASLGLVGIVYGFSSAESAGWSDLVTILALVAGLGLVIVFVALESSISSPLLPLRLLLDRSRGAAFLTTSLASLASFSVFLFLAYYLQTVRGYSPLQSGVAFLPLPATLAVTSIVVAPRLLLMIGVKTMIVAGSVVGAVAMLLLLMIGLSSDYWLTVGPALVVLGIGMGNVFAVAPNLATAGIEERDAGIASAFVNVSQQVGGSIGTAVLSTVAGQVAVRYVREHGADAASQARAQLASYHAAFLASAAVFLVLAIVVAFMLRPVPLRTEVS